MRRVAVVTPGSFVIPSGRSSSVERVIEQVVPLASREIDARIYGTAGAASKGFPSKGEIEGVPCIRLPSGAAYLPALVRRLRQWRPDVIEVHNRPIIAYRLKTRLHGVKTVLSLHSNTFIQPIYLKEAQLKQIIKSMDGVIVNSHYLLEQIAACFPWVKPKMIVNHLGVRLEHFTPRHTPASEAFRTARLRRYGWEGRKILLFVGRLIPDKGVHHLLAALPKIIEEHPETLLLIIGSAGYGTDRETAYVKELKRAAEPYSKWVSFLSFIPYPSITAWYSLADIVLVPSAEREAFGLVNIEAMAAGVPVVAAHSGGIPEIIEDGVNGFLIPKEHLSSRLADRVNWLFSHEKIRKSLGLAGRETCRQRFTWEHTAQRWTKTMQNI